jgi:23S rRNA pseudouridine2604 synthase
MNITLAKLPLGQWRELTDTEIEMLHSLVADSVKTEEGSVGKKKASANQSQPARKKPSGNRPPRKDGGAGGKSSFGASGSRGQRGASKGPGASRNAPSAKGGGRKRR